MPSTADTTGVRLAELVATLSLAADLGLGQPMEHCLRQTAIALRLADLVGADEVEREATYYLGLLVNVYCHSDASEQARWYGDDIGLKADAFERFRMSPAQNVAYVARRITAEGNGFERARRLVTVPLTAGRTIAGFLTTHSLLAAQFAERLGLSDATCTAMLQAYEQWDGEGVPRRLAGAQITLPPRVVQLSSVLEVYGRRDTEAARAIARRHAGTEFDPDLVDVISSHIDDIFADLGEAAGWDAIVAAEPCLSRIVRGAELDTVLEAMADLVDLKSPYLAGHSRGVANLAGEAARISGLSEQDSLLVRRAGLIHDLGRLGVSNAIWDKAGRLTAAELERVRLHPYLTDRMLARVPAVSRCREIAARHHERLDGTGYPRGLTGASLTTLDRLLAVADAYHALTEPRPHRPALTADEASQELLAEVKAGRLDGDATKAVLKAAGHRAPGRRMGPAGLTAREVEVLVLLARGYSNKQIARRLDVTPKTVSNHVEHVYTKAGVSSRAAATLFAIQQGLIGSYEPA